MRKRSPLAARSPPIAGCSSSMSRPRASTSAPRQTFAAPFRRNCGQGTAIIVAISDFEELLALCDRVLVVSDGRIIAERRAADTSEHELMALAGGLTN